MQSSVVDAFELSQESQDAAEQAAARSLALAIAKAHGVRASVSAQKLLAILSNPNVTLREVTRTIEVDSSLAARVLRVVNSSAYGLRVRVRKISVAVTLLGSKRLGEIATAAAVLDWFEQESQAVPEVFRHSSATAALARHVATRAGVPAEEMYTCGLLHDYGRLILLQTGDASYARLVDDATDDDDVCAGERAAYGFDHAVLGARMLAEWKLPAPLPDVIALHHQPARARRLGGVLAVMVATLRWAERLEREFGRAMPIDDAWVDRMARDEDVRLLGLARGDFHRLCLDLHLTWLESQRPPSPDGGPDDLVDAAPSASALSRVDASAVLAPSPAWWRARSIAVALGLASLALACAGAVALLNGRPWEEYLAAIPGPARGALAALSLACAAAFGARAAIVRRAR